MDVLVCNGLGIYCGMKTLEWLSLKTYKWQGLWNIPTYKYVSRAADLVGLGPGVGPGGPQERMLPPVNSTWDVTLGIALNGNQDISPSWPPSSLSSLPALLGSPLPGCLPLVKK